MKVTKRELIEQLCGEKASAREVLCYSRWTISELRVELRRAEARSRRLLRQEENKWCPTCHRKFKFCNNLMHRIVNIKPWPAALQLQPKEPANGILHEWVTDEFPA